MTQGADPAVRARTAEGRAKSAGGGLARSSLLMAVGTVVSRATGLIRQVLQAAALGTGLLASTYNTANTVPTSLYTLLIGGALNAVLVPQLVRARATEPDGGRAYEQRLVTLVVCVLGVGTALAVWAAPEIVGLYMRDTPGSHEAFELTVTFARFLLPQIFFYGLFGIYGQVLNAREKFGAMMWTPVLNNVVLVAMFAAYLGLMVAPGRVEDITADQVRLLGIGTTAGVALQALALVPFARAAGFRFRPRFDWRGTGLGRSVHAAKWTLLFVLANQVALTVVTHFANAADQELPEAGAGYTAYMYAQTIWLLPQSIVTVSLVTALLPRMSRAVAEGRVGDLRADLTRGLRISGVVIVPTAFLFLALGPQIAALLFAHGAADADSVRPLGQMLQAFGPGLIAFSAQYLLLRGFYAFEDTRTPFFMAAWIAGVDIALASACHLLLPARWAVVGMAGAYTLSYLAGLALTARLLRRRLGGRIGTGGLGRAYGKVLCAAVPAAGLGWAAARAVSGPGGPGAAGTWSTAVALASGVLSTAVAYLLLARLLKVEEVRRLPGLR
ncbi:MULTISPECIES: murein biosynthesis integral membrane protein MurJ [Streptomyces]|uniref:Murein biosynthesis integral membrane protein MurJ n=1 Tax=Streptomyces albidoflavus TaxID=1886 RepID=A0A8G1ZTU5_9ACTN|nr:MULTISPECIES: murein biosynthesis integral membrane protein MurJ [Streptomyces]MYX85666.1 murein biosynthesis integral membrane protein MurJ [Streptomyces sp. SID4915]AWL34935.1 murein biosynthesis integral membrane protein MurJ [Streptomyces sp. SM17]MBT2880484.1 murein biosynthesis integral membrane protein MurJ [Streptomyces sp. McG6]MBT2887046.1 murein biosynthesis integral membrane protein MurJ [Streptomyces sp. McG5]MBT2893522.1 murein biosynthesis integral membrane protein MurJ [Stre